MEMKIEFLYKDDTYKPIIEKINEALNLEENEITYIPIVQVGLNIFSFSKSGENETTAKKLDEIKKAISKSINPENLFIITDDVSSYFCQRLYPQMANFERGLRKVLYIASIKSKDEKVISVCKQIEQQEFAPIYQMLFSDTNYVTEARKVVNSKSPELSKHDIIKQLRDLPESTLWDKLFGDKYSYIAENFLDIKDGRNKIMHSRNISFEEYSTIKNNLDKSNRILRAIEYDVLEKDNFNSDEMLNSIAEALGALSKVVVNAASNMLSSVFLEYWGQRALANYKPSNTEESLILEEVNDTTDTDKKEKELCSVN
jgi:hypothetical protein